MSICRFSAYAEKFYRCQTCGTVASSKAARVECGSAGDWWNEWRFAYQSLPQGTNIFTGGGPGTELAKRFASLGATACRKCRWIEYAMNHQGPAWCLAHQALIAQAINRNLRYQNMLTKLAYLVPERMRLSWLQKQIAEVCRELLD